MRQLRTFGMIPVVGYPYPYLTFMIGGLGGVSRRQTTLVARRQVEDMLGAIRQGSAYAASPYAEYLIELIRTLDLEGLIEPYI
jgi:hypothetical protein